MKKTSLFLTLLSLITLFSACRNTDPTATKEKTPAATPVVILTCISKGEDENGTPKSEVLLSVDGKESIVASTLACQEIPKQDYAQYEIPEQAIAACGGWWAGAGKYYYVALKDGAVTVYEGWNEEEQTDKGYHWKAMPMGK